MLQRRTASNGVVMYVSPILEAIGVRHAFSTRIGGVSDGAFAWLNLGNPPGRQRDTEENLVENRRRLLAAMGCGGCTLVHVEQVHGAAVVDACQVGGGRQADGLISSDRQRAVAIRTADCVPVLVSDEGGRTVAAVHAGWRGIVAGVIASAIETVRGSSGHAALAAAIGPCIGAQAYEVGPEVLEVFAEAFSPHAPVVRGSDGKGYVDLRQAVRRQLVESGVEEDAIDLSDRCTHRDGGEFFSHRRDGPVTGRMMAVIAPR